MNSPLISIIVPIYNVSSYVEKCLKSVLFQTYKNLQIIVVDDCGKDDSMLIAEHILNGQFIFPYKIIRHDHNRGLSAARNSGILAGDGDYIYFLDSDDWIKPDTIELLAAMALNNPGVEMVQGGMFCEEEQMNRFIHTPASYLGDSCTFFDRGKCRDLIQSGKMCPMAQNRLIRRDFIVNHRLYFKDGLIHEDELWTFNLGKYISSIAFLKQDVYYYRVTSTGITQSMTTEKHFEYICIVSDEMLSAIETRNLKWHSLELIYILSLLNSAFNSCGRNPLQSMKNGHNLFLQKLFLGNRNEYLFFYGFKGRVLRLSYFVYRLIFG